MTNPFDQFDAVPYNSSNPFDQFDNAGSPTTTAAKSSPSFLEGMRANFDAGIQAGRELVADDVQVPGRSKLTPKTQALGDKLFPPGSEGGLLETVGNIRNTVPSDFSGALLEKFGETPEGKALAVIGGVNPAYNAASTAFTQYINPAIQDATSAAPDTFVGKAADHVLKAAVPGYALTKQLMPEEGIAQDNLALLELAGGAVSGAKGIKSGKPMPTDPTLNAIKYAAEKLPIGEKSGGIPTKILTDAPGITAEAIRGKASEYFKLADEKGGTLKPTVTNKWIDEAAKAIPQTAEGRTVLGDTPVTQLVQRMQELRDKPLTLQGALEIDSALGEMASSAVDPKTGKVLAEGKKLYDIQHSLRNAWDKAGEGDIVGGKAGYEAAKQGRDLWSAAARMNDIERIIAKAEMTDNPVSSMRTGFRNLAMNPSRLRGFTAEEVKAINNAAKTGVVTGILRVAGSRLGPIAASPVGYMAGGPLGAAAGFAANYLVSGAARAGAEKLQGSRGNAVLQEVAKRVKEAPAAEKPAPVSQPQKLLPAPPQEMIVDMQGKIRPMSPEELAVISPARMREAELGLTPDVRRAQDVNLANEMQQKYGQSEIGQLAIKNRNLLMKEIAKLPPAQARKLLQK